MGYFMMVNEKWSENFFNENKLRAIVANRNKKIYSLINEKLKLLTSGIFLLAHFI